MLKKTLRLFSLLFYAGFEHSYKVLQKGACLSLFLCIYEPGSFLLLVVHYPGGLFLAFIHGYDEKAAHVVLVDLSVGGSTDAGHGSSYDSLGAADIAVFVLLAGGAA
jgi:hypothetical protein